MKFGARSKLSAEQTAVNDLDALREDIVMERDGLPDDVGGALLAKLERLTHKSVLLVAPRDNGVGHVHVLAGERQIEFVTYIAADRVHILRVLRELRPRDDGRVERR